MIDAALAHFLMSTCEDFLSMEGDMTLTNYQLRGAIEEFVADAFEDIRDAFGYVTIHQLNETIQYVADELERFHPQIISENTSFTDRPKRIILKQKIELDDDLFKL